MFPAEGECYNIFNKYEHPVANEKEVKLVKINYQHEKRQKELEKKRKKEQKIRRKQEKKNLQQKETPIQPQDKAV